MACHLFHAPPSIRSSHGLRTRTDSVMQGRPGLRRPGEGGQEASPREESGARRSVVGGRDQSWKDVCRNREGWFRPGWTPTWRGRCRLRPFAGAWTRCESGLERSKVTEVRSHGWRGRIGGAGLGGAWRGGAELRWPGRQEGRRREGRGGRGGRAGRTRVALPPCHRATVAQTRLIAHGRKRVRRGGPADGG